MPRLPRLFLPGQAHHVIQRGNNRQPILFHDTDPIPHDTDRDGKGVRVDTDAAGFADNPGFLDIWPGGYWTPGFNNELH